MMAPFRMFDPYKKDEDRRLHERGLEAKKLRESLTYQSAEQKVFAALARRKKRPVTLPPIKGGS
jgi:hypothetical protein